MRRAARAADAAARRGAERAGGHRDRRGHGRGPAGAERGRLPADGVHHQDHDRARRARRGERGPRLHGEKGVYAGGRLVDVFAGGRKAHPAGHAVRADAGLGQRRGGRHRGRMRRHGGFRAQDERQGRVPRPDEHAFRQPERPAVQNALYDRARAGEADGGGAARPGVPPDRRDEELYGERPHAGQPQPPALDLRQRDRRQDRLHPRRGALSGLRSGAERPHDRVRHAERPG